MLPPVSAGGRRGHRASAITSLGVRTPPPSASSRSSCRGKGAPPPPPGGPSPPPPPQCQQPQQLPRQAAAERAQRDLFRAPQHREPAQQPDLDDGGRGGQPGRIGSFP